MQSSYILRAWRKIAAGHAPTLSIEITRECPLHCPGCYAYDPAHLGGDRTLRELNDFHGQALIDGVLDLADRLKPLHISLVGGDPLVRYRELTVLVPELLNRGIHVQVVTSAFRPLPQEWVGLKHLNVSVSIDGLPAEHDLRRAPATYERILKNIAGHHITVHCTITGQMMKRKGYLEDFLRFWSARAESSRIWFSLFTPQQGDDLPEILTSRERDRAIEEMLVLRGRYRKLDMPAKLIRQFASPPSDPAHCTFAKSTLPISADLKTVIAPCQFGGHPDCSSCGCYAAMGLNAISAHRLLGFLPVGLLFHTSHRLGQVIAKRREPAPKELVQIAPMS